MTADNPVQAKRTPLWIGPAPVGDGATEETADANAFITVHRAAKPNGTAIVICPGGGYGGLVVGPEGHGIAAWLNEHGITGVVLEYRLPKGRHAVPLLDAQRAIRTIRANAKNWDINETKIGIMGFSAGGHLAATAATHFDAGNAAASDPVDRVSSRPDFAILVYPVVTMGETTHSGTKMNLLGKDPAPELLELYSNERQVTAETPPTFLAHALDDKPVPPENSRAMFAALQKHNVPSKYLELPSGGHGLNGYKGPMWDAWQQQSLAWLADLNLLPPADTISDIPYGDEHERQVLDVYAPDGAKDLPVMFWIHGGGWQHGDKSDVALKPKVMTERGFVFVSTNYRLLPDVEMDVLIRDVAKSLGWVHSNITKYGGDPKRIFVGGHSAGAQLAALICIDDRYLKEEGVSFDVLKGCVPVDGDTYDIPRIISTAEHRQTLYGGKMYTFGHRQKFGNDPEKHVDFSAVTHVAKNKGIPPFLILYFPGNPDTRAQAGRLEAVLKESDIPVTTFGKRDSNHSRLNNDLGKPDDPATQELYKFLDPLVIGAASR